MQKAIVTRDQMLHKHISERYVHIPELFPMQTLSYNS